MSQHFDRIVFTHDRRNDFELTASSLSWEKNNRWQPRLRSRIRSEYQANRPQSTVYWTNGHDAAVIRRLPRHRGDARDDVAHVLVGPVEQLDVRRALSLPNWAGWTDPGWDGQLSAIAVDELPNIGQLWDPAELKFVAEDVLWPMVDAFLRSPSRMLSVYRDDLTEDDIVRLIRGFVGMAEVLRPDDRRIWTFSTRETKDGGATDADPRLLFLPGHTDFSLIERPRSAVRYPYQGASREDEDRYRLLVRCYLWHGPDMLEKAYNGERLPEDVLRGWQTEDASKLVPTTPMPSRRQPNEWELVLRMRGTLGDQLPDLVRQIELAPLSSGDRRESIRRDLLGQQGLIHLLATCSDPAEAVRMACVLVERTVRGNEWQDRDVLRLLDETITHDPVSPVAHAVLLTAIKHNAMLDHPESYTTMVWNIVSKTVPSVPAVQPSTKPVPPVDVPVPVPTHQLSLSNRGWERLTMTIFLESAVIVLLLIVLVELAVSHG